MTETAPKYFLEFRKEIMVILNGHTEQIAEVSEKVTSLQEDMKEIKQELVAANRRADRHSEKILIGIKKLDNHETRIDKLERETIV